MPGPIQYSGAAVDLSPRIFKSAVVAASPAASAETVVCSLTINEDIAIMEGVWLTAFVAFTQGTNGTGATLKIRRTDASGTVLASTGIIAVAAAVLESRSLVGFDAAAPVVGQVYVVTALMTAATAPSTFSACNLVALAV